MGEGKEVIFHGQLLRFEKGVKQVQTRSAKYGKSWDGVRDPDTRNECKTGGWIKRETFESHIQDAELSVKTRDGKVLTPFQMILPCPLKRRHWTPTHTHGQNPIIACLLYTEKKW